MLQLISLLASVSVMILSKRMYCRMFIDIKLIIVMVIMLFVMFICERILMCFICLYVICVCVLAL